MFILVFAGRKGKIDPPKTPAVPSPSLSRKHPSSQVLKVNFALR